MVSPKEFAKPWNWKCERGEPEHPHRSNVRGHGTAATPRIRCLPMVRKGWAVANGRILQFQQMKLA